MTVEEVSKRQEWRALQRERERERRRMRDRQRRQSMSLEEREKHLARRRRNYQLRRQRVENAKLDSQQEQYIIGTRANGQERANASATKSEGSAATGVHKSAKYPRRLCLNQIKHLARLLNTPVDNPCGESHQIVADVMRKERVRRRCRSRSLRLIHVKRLARALNSCMKDAADKTQLSETQVEENLLQGEIQLMSSDVEIFTTE
ncbi:hypothetical protein F0562_027026 [Nyssa sinensis]|uniref:Uncharacterized protein n=1 Tax=Nyssa sinensis TaxID=561372 RepID=A0A5J5B6B1_9ASTE|nr:hypothetical protein F0562_027026 [Nyssa sinensis]